MRTEGGHSVTPPRAGLRDGAIGNPPPAPGSIGGRGSATAPPAPRTRPANMSEQELLLDCVRRLNRTGAAYMLTGSMASNAWGIPRTTHDLDFVLQLPPSQITSLVAAFASPDYFLDEAAVRAAYQPPHQFNLIHIPSALKADFWLLRPAPFEREMFSRRVKDAWFGETIWLATARTSSCTSSIGIASRPPTGNSAMSAAWWRCSAAGWTRLTCAPGRRNWVWLPSWKLPCPAHSSQSKPELKTESSACVGLRRRISHHFSSESLNQRPPAALGSKPLSLRTHCAALRVCLRQSGRGNP